MTEGAVSTAVRSWPPFCFSTLYPIQPLERKVEPMRKLPLLFLMLFLIGGSVSWAQLSQERDRSGTGLPNRQTPGTLPDLKTDPKFGDHGSGVPCPPGSQSGPNMGAPNTGDDFGDKGGMTQDQSSPRGRHAVPPVPSDPDAGINTPQSRQGEKDGGLSRSDELNKPGLDKQNRADQFGMTDCPPGGTDRGGGLNPRNPSTPGQENSPPVLLPPAGSAP